MPNVDPPWKPCVWLVLEVCGSDFGNRGLALQDNKLKPLLRGLAHYERYCAPEDKKTISALKKDFEDVYLQYKLAKQNYYYEKFFGWYLVSPNDAVKKAGTSRLRRWVERMGERAYGHLRKVQSVPATNERDEIR